MFLKAFLLHGPKAFEGGIRVKTDETAQRDRILLCIKAPGHTALSFQQILVQEYMVVVPHHYLA